MWGESAYVSLYCDRRLGGMEHWIYGPVPERMRIRDELLECVVFLGIPKATKGHFTIGGTAFFVSLPSASTPGSIFIYLVTARHCIEEAAKTGDNLWIRINTKAGGSTWAELNVEWHVPDDPAIDVAVLPLMPDQATFKYKVLPSELFVNETISATKGIGLGDELLVTGLFPPRSGAHRNLPIARAGILAGMPDEPFIDENGRPYDAYLAEMRSIGGLSGSPVFLALGGLRPQESGMSLGGVEYYLLGLIRGHWDVKKKDSPDFAETELRDVNMGMALVTPIYHAFALLNGETLTKARRAIENTMLQEMAPTKDSALTKEASEFDRFEELTRNLVNVPKKEIDEKRKRKA